MPGGYNRIIQQDLSGGMFTALAPELIPDNGAFDITNGLLNEQNVVYRRGGSTYLTSAPAGAGVRLLWSGYLKNGGLQTVLCTETESFTVGPAGLTKIGLVPPKVLSQATVFQGVLYVPGEAGTLHAWDGASALTDGRTADSPFFAVAGNHLVVGSGARISVSDVPKAEGEALKWHEETNFMQLPEGVAVTGMFGWRTSVVVFTTQGIWLINGLAHEEITDESGNIFWTQDRYSADAVLWAAAGLAAWKGGLVVPCKDDVWIMELGVSSERSAPFRPISGPIQNIYRDYIAAGYTPGLAHVRNGHYFLPILAGENVVDLLVCRLEGVNDKGNPEPAWTHLKGYGAQLSALTSVSDIEGQMIGATAGLARVLELGYFAPGVQVENDANGDLVGFEITTRSIPTGGIVPNLVGKARLSYRLVAGPTTKMKLAVGATPYSSEWGAGEWGAGEWQAVAGPFVDLGESIPPALADPEALTPKTWRVGKKVRFLRMHISLNGPASQVSLRALELAVRADGRVF